MRTGLRADHEDALDVEPAPSGDVPPCWGAFVADATQALSNDADPERLARALMALSDRTQRLGSSPATADVLFGKLATLRDATGGYGSSAATVAVLRALLASQLEGHGTTRARVRVAAGRGVAALDREIDVSESGIATIALPPGALDVSVETAGPGLV